MPAATAATPSSASTKLAANSASASWTIWARASSFQVPKPFPPSPKSSARAPPDPPDRQDFCPSYRLTSQITELADVFETGEHRKAADSEENSLLIPC